MRSRTFLLAVVLVGSLLGCGDTAPPGSRSREYQPVDATAAVFWDRQTTESAALLRALAEEFNQQWPGLPVKVERSGSYADIFRKVTAGIRAGQLPAMAVSYESMTTEYIPMGAVAALDALIADPELGISEDKLADYYPMMLETNRFDEHGGKYYSFPFAKSLLMLYYNKAVLDAAGIECPPETWDDFIAQCRIIKAETGHYAHAVSADCSTLNGIIFSMGGDIVRGRETLYDSPEALAAFRLYETLHREALAYLIPPGSYDDNMALAKDDIAFALRSSAGLSDMLLLMEGDRDRWGITRIPQNNPDTPATVLYGPNVCIFNTTQEQKQAAWAFVRHFTTPEKQVRWSLETGYLPVRRSALEHPDMHAFWEEWPYNRAAYDCLPIARPEPNIAGWQEVRDLAARTITEVMTGMRSAESAAQHLKESADRALQQVAAAQAHSR